MKITTKYADTMRSGCEVSLATAGVLGEVFVDLDCRSAKGGPIQNGDELPTKDTPQLQDVVRASQGTLENMNVLLKRVDDIVSYIQSGQGSIGALIYDKSLFNRANDTLTQMQHIVAQLNEPKGSIGKLLNSDELYNKANAAIDNLNKIIDEVNSGQGTVGKFLKDPSLYNNANKTVAKAMSWWRTSMPEGHPGQTGEGRRTGQADRQHHQPPERHRRPARQGRRLGRQVPQGSCALRQHQQAAGRDPQPDRGHPPGSQEIPDHPLEAFRVPRVAACGCRRAPSHAISPAADRL